MTNEGPFETLLTLPLHPYHTTTKRLLFKVRLHLGPYLVAHADKQGKGFGFVQSSSTLEELFLLRPMGPRGQPLERAVVVHYLTMCVTRNACICGRFCCCAHTDRHAHTPSRAEPSRSTHRYHLHHHPQQPNRGEFVSVVLEDDFELAFAKDSLEQALATYDPATHYIVLLKLRCGYAAVLRVPLLGVGLCRSLAADYQYAEHPELQLNID